MLKLIFKNLIAQSNSIMYFLVRLSDWKSVVWTPSLAHLEFSSCLPDCACITNSEGSSACLFSCALNPLYLGLFNQKMLMLPSVYLPSISSRVNCGKCRGDHSLAWPPSFFSGLPCLCGVGIWEKAPGKGSSEALVGVGRTFIYMKTACLFFLIFFFLNQQVWDKKETDFWRKKKKKSLRNSLE